MKKLIAMLLSITLLVLTAGCAGGGAEPTDAGTNPQQTVGTDSTGTETPPQQTESSEPEKVTVDLMEKTVIFDYGYQIYSYDENHNIIGIETFSLEEDLLYKIHFNKQDANGMFCERVEEWDGDSQISAFKWFQDGKLQEEQYNPGYSGDQFEYDAAGRVTQMRNYYNGILNYAVHFTYNGDELQSVYCENAEGRKLYDCKIADGRITEKNHYNAEGAMDYAYTYKYDNNGNLEQTRFVMDGDDSPCDTHSYRAVEVDASRAPYLIAQQQYLLDITHTG